MSADVSPPAKRVSISPEIGRWASKYGVIVALGALLIVAAIWTPIFFDPVNLRNTARSASFIGIVTIGQFLVLMVRGIDLSVTAVLAFTAVLIAERGPGLGMGLLVAAFVVVAVGAANTFFIVRREVPPFVATFGMLITLEGLRLAYTRGSASGPVPSEVTSVGRDVFFGLTYSVWTWLFLLVVTGLFLYKTAAGRRMIMTGANPEMAALSGVRTGWVVAGAFTASAALAGLSGIFVAGSAGYVDRFIGQGTELDSITAALLAGASFRGGEGSLLGAAAASLLLASLFTVIVLLGWPPELQLIAKGAVLIAALSLQSALRKRPA